MMDFLFELSPWETFLQTQKGGGSVSAWHLLTLVESEDDDAMEELFERIQEMGLSVDISTIPKIAPSGQSALRLMQEEAYVASGLNPRDMEENDPLRLFLEELEAISPEGDEVVLADRLSSGDDSAADMLARIGLHRVVALAPEFLGHQVLLMDLIQEGSMGLWQGLQSYSGEPYCAWRDRWIRNAMAKAVMLQARSSGLGQKMREALQDYKSVDEKLLTELGRNPSLEEIADQMHIGREEAQLIQKMYQDALMVRQPEAVSQPTEESQEENMAVEDTAYFQMRQRIIELLSQLSEEEAKILTLRFGLEKGLPMSTEDAGRILGLSSGEIAAREAAALTKLRTTELRMKDGSTNENNINCN